jgi:N-formylglutamate amidohydrolase
MIKYILLSLIICSKSYGQIIFGTNNYIEYRQGNLPIIISVPHGGNLTPSSIPNRTCNSAVTVTDANTIELARQIDSAFVNATGCHPYIIYCHLHRSKLDCNRNIADGACGNAEAETAWNEFNNFINSAQSLAQSQFGGKALYIDLHGHGNSIQRLELGYLLYDTELANTDSVLNTSEYVGYSSIQNLVATNVNTYTHSQLLRGPFALGTLLGNAGYPSVPSQQIPFPGTTTNYFSGGYNTAHHTSYVTSNTVNGLQMECNYANVRDSYMSRKLFSDSLVSVIQKFLIKHQTINFSNCTLTSIEPVNSLDDLLISPNPAKDYIQISYNNSVTDFEIEIMNTLGQTLFKTNNQNTLNIEKLERGLYFIKLTDQHKNTKIQKVLFQ